jgi:hypothetical protein
MQRSAFAKRTYADGAIASEKSRVPSGVPFFLPLFFSLPVGTRAPEAAAFPALALGL